MTQPSNNARTSHPQSTSIIHIIQSPSSEIQPRNGGGDFMGQFISSLGINTSQSLGWNIKNVVDTLSKSKSSFSDFLASFGNQVHQQLDKAVNDTVTAINNIFNCNPIGSNGSNATTTTTGSRRAQVGVGK